jgi:hypothetical protein
MTAQGPALHRGSTLSANACSQEHPLRMKRAHTEILAIQGRAQRDIMFTSKVATGPLQSNAVKAATGLTCIQLSLLM